jgi:phage FluMu protein Com
MVEIKCITIPKPQDGSRPIYRKNTNDKGISEKESLIQGNFGKELVYICGNCGNCGYLLAENVSQGEISVDIIFECPNCQAYNETYNVESRPVT